MTSFILPISFYNFPVKIDASVQFKRTKHDIVLCKKACSMQRKILGIHWETSGVPLEFLISMIYEV